MIAIEACQTDGADPRAPLADPDASSSVCTASTASELQACLGSAATAGSTTAMICIPAPIELPPNDGSSSAFAYVGSAGSPTSPLVITGYAGSACMAAETEDCNGLPMSTGGLCRSGSGVHAYYSWYDALAIQSSSRPIAIENLVFDDGANNPLPLAALLTSAQAPIDVMTNAIGASESACIATAAANPCVAMSLNLSDAHDVVIAGDTFIGAKDRAIRIDASSHIIVRDSTIDGAFVYAIWADPTSSGIHIENNTFSHNRSNAVFVAGMAPGSDDPFAGSAFAAPYNTVTGNYFVDNSNTGLDFVGSALDQSITGSDGEIYGAGQLYVAEGAWSYYVENNEFADGGDRSTIAYAEHAFVRGIEIPHVSVAGLQIRNNYIHDQSDVGIVIGHGSGSPADTRIAIQDNVFANNDTENQQLSEISNEWYLLSAANGSGTLISGAEYGSAYFEESQTAGYADDAANCVEPAPSCAFAPPSYFGAMPVVATPGIITATPCSLQGSASCTSTIAWGSGAAYSSYSVILDDAKLFAKTAGAASQTADFISSTPHCFDLYASYTLVGSTCVTTQ